MSENRVASGGMPDAYVADGTEKIRMVDLCDLCQRIRTFWTLTDGVCKSNSHRDTTGQRCLVSFYSAQRLK